MQGRRNVQVMLLALLILSLTLGGCTNSNDIKRISNSNISGDFRKTIESYFNLQEDFFDVSIYGFVGTKPAVSSYAIGNLLDKLSNLGQEDMETENPYLLSTLLTISDKKNRLDLKALGENANQRDFAIGFKALNYIENQDGIEKLAEI